MKKRVVTQISIGKNPLIDKEVSMFGFGGMGGCCKGG